MTLTWSQNLSVGSFSSDVHALKRETAEKPGCLQSHVRQAAGKGPTVGKAEGDRQLRLMFLIRTGRGRISIQN